MDDSLGERQRRERELNVRVYELFRENGGNSWLPCKVVQYFYAPSEGQMQILKHRLEEQGYRIEDVFPTNAEPGGAWGLQAETRVMPEPTIIDALTDDCVALADELDCEYDGWDIEIRKTDSE